MKIYQKLKYKKSGFSLIEVLMSVGLLAAIAGIASPLYQSYQNRNNLEIAGNSIAQSLRRAQVLSRSVDGDSSWGVRVQTGKVVIFRGASYAARNTAYDEEYEIAATIGTSGLNEIVFEKFTGKPLVTGFINLNSLNNETKSIAINEKGAVSY